MKEDAKRIEEIKKFAGMTWKQLAVKIDIPTSQRFIDIKSGRHGITKALATKICDAFPELDYKWVLLGDGDMLATESASVPVINSKGGESIDLSSLFPNAQAAMLNTSDAMDEYPVGVILILKEVNDKTLMVPGNDYLVETSEFTMVRRMQKGSGENRIAMYATNTTTYPDGKAVYEPFELAMDAITRAYSIIGYVYSSRTEIGTAKV